MEKAVEPARRQLKDLPVAELLKQLQSSPEGLSQAEAANRLERYGYNELPEKKVNPFLKFLSYFWGPIPVMIIIAAVLSGALRHWPDLGLILTLLVMNAVVGFREEYQAGNTVAALKARLAVRHANSGNFYRCLRTGDDSARLEMGRCGLGIRPGLVPGQRPGEAAGI
jgi:H+-transporting ATPase